MLKKKIRTIASLSMIILLSACVEESIYIYPSSQAKLVTSIVGTGGQSFREGDTIGVYPVKYKEGLPGIAGDISNLLNIPYTYDGIRWNTNPGKEIYVDIVPVDLYAYYPYDPQLSGQPDKLNLTAYPFDLSGNQNGRELDFLWANADMITGRHNTAGMVFNHLMARFEINLTFESPQDIPDVALHNAITNSLIDLRRGVALLAESHTGIIFPKLCNGRDGMTNFTFEAILPPQSIPAETPLLTITWDGGETTLYTLPEAMELKAQKNYIFNLLVGSASERGSRRMPEMIEMSR